MSDIQIFSVQDFQILANAYYDLLQKLVNAKIVLQHNTGISDITNSLELGQAIERSIENNRHDLITITKLL